MEKKNRTVLLFFVLLAAISFLITLSPVTNFPKTVLSSLSSFPLKLISLSLVPVEAIANCNRSLRNNRELKRENQQLRVSLMQLREAVAENERLSKLLSFKEKTSLSLIASKVISFDASNLRRSLIINRGNSSGIRLGDSVITSEGFVGMIVELGKSFSRIILINDLDFSMSAKTERSNAIGVISGSFEGTCKLKYLNLDDDIKIGDEVISSGKNSSFPAGIPAGVVTSVKKDESGLTLSAIVMPKAKLSSLEEVLVIVGYQ